MCPHTVICVSSYCYMLCVLMLEYVCPPTSIFVSSYWYICVLILLYVCPHTVICDLILIWLRICGTFLRRVEVLTWVFRTLIFMLLFSKPHALVSRSCASASENSLVVVWQAQVYLAGPSLGSRRVSRSCASVRGVDVTLCGGGGRERRAKSRYNASLKSDLVCQIIHCRNTNERSVVLG
jgi:hypothetical protein